MGQRDDLAHLADGGLLGDRLLVEVAHIDRRGERRPLFFTSAPLPSRVPSLTGQALEPYPSSAISRCKKSRRSAVAATCLLIEHAAEQVSVAHEYCRLWLKAYQAQGLYLLGVVFQHAPKVNSVY
jgi:hypothetical protein